jgi:phage terminase small subunit
MGVKQGSPRRKLFPAEYLVDLNATKAAQRCGFSKKTAYSQGQRLLKNVEIQKAIQHLQAARSERLEITADQWLREFACPAFLDPIDIFEDDGSLKQIKDMPESARRAIAGLEVTEIFDGEVGGQKHAIGLAKKIKFVSKIEAGKVIGEHLGFLKGNRLEIPGLEKALYEISEKFFPIVRAKKRSDEPARNGCSRRSRSWGSP